jgi:outer membrane immunogenic protein
MGRFGSVSVAGILAVAVAGVAATAAFAADLPPAAPPPPRAPAAYVPVVSPVYNWTGFYLGLNAGYGIGNSTWTGPNLVNGQTGNFAVDGAMFGATLGGNYQIGQFVLGVEGDYDWQNIRGSQVGGGCTAVFPGGNVAGSCDTASNWLATIRGRVGYAFDRIMVYGTAGGAFTDVKASAGALTWSSTFEPGWTAGGGIEGAITDNLTAKIEYLYVDFENATCAAGSCSVQGGTPTVTLKENVIRAGLNYKFGF